MATLESKIAVPEAVLFQELDGEAILLHQGTGKYYGLDKVGTRMWLALTRHGAIAPALRDLLAEYDVTETQLQHDLLAWVEELAAHGLMEVHEA